MNLESKHGFRSCFNFVPEGEYCFPDAVRQTLAQAGFEVGVHGLEHDGKLYSSKASFAAKAAGSGNICSDGMPADFVLR